MRCNPRGAAVLERSIDAVFSPTLRVEVLSPSIQKRGRGSKSDSYRAIPSFRQILVISQDRIFLQHYQREKGWMIISHSNPAESIESAELGEIPVREFYEEIQDRI